MQVLDEHSFITVPLAEAEIILKSFKKKNMGVKLVDEKSQEAVICIKSLKQDDHNKH